MAKVCFVFLSQCVKHIKVDFLGLASTPRRLHVPFEPYGAPIRSGAASAPASSDRTFVHRLHELRLELKALSFIPPPRVIDVRCKYDF